MKARVKATGEIVDVQKISDYDSHGKYIGYYFQTINSPFKAFHNGDLDFEYLDREPDNYWEKLKHQYAGMAMQAYITRHDDDRFYIDDLAKDAVNLPPHSLRNLKESNMVSKKTRKKRQKADIRLAIHLLAMRQTNLTASFNDALLNMLQKIDELQKEVEKLKKERK